MTRYDIAIIGTGPAGLEAAITAKIRNKDIIVFGSASGSDKVEKSHLVENYLGIPSTTGKDLMRTFLDHAISMGVEITQEKVSTVYPMGDVFSIQSSKGEMYEASSVILAAGVSAGKTYDGEEEYLGRGVSYCATCDAALFKGKDVAIVGFSPDEEAEADFMAEFAGRVMYFPQYDGDVNVAPSIEIVREKPVAVEGDMKVRTFRTDSNEYSLDGVFFLRESIAPGNLVPGLKTAEKQVEVDRNMATNIPGLFACGDITGAPYQLTKAAGEGNVAALSAVSYLYEKQRNKDRKGE